MKNIDALVESLNALGSVGIADFLAEKGVKGHSAPNSCPVARYLHDEINEPVAVFPTTYVHGGQSRQLPPEVHKFVNLYDSGNFPELNTK